LLGSTKKWGQADSDLLADLTNRLIDITDHPPKYRRKRLHFWHCNNKNIRCNFRDYSAVWDLEIEYSGARRNGGKMRHFLKLIFLPVRVLSRIASSHLPSSFCRKHAFFRRGSYRRRTSTPPPPPPTLLPTPATTTPPCRPKHAYSNEGCHQEGFEF